MVPCLGSAVVVSHGSWRQGWYAAVSLLDFVDWIFPAVWDSKTMEGSGMERSSADGDICFLEPAVYRVACSFGIGDSLAANRALSVGHGDVVEEKGVWLNKGAKNSKRKMGGSAADRRLFDVSAGALHRCLDSAGCGKCFDSGGNLFDCAFMGFGETVYTVGQNCGGCAGAGGIVYDKGFLAEYFLVGVSFDSRDRVDPFCGSE